MIIPHDLFPKIAAIFPNLSGVYRSEFEPYTVRYGVSFGAFGPKDARLSLEFTSPKGAAVRVLIAEKSFQIRINDLYYPNGSSESYFYDTDELEQPLRKIVEKAFQELFRWVLKESGIEVRKATPSKEDFLKSL